MIRQLYYFFDKAFTSIRQSGNVSASSHAPLGHCLGLASTTSRTFPGREAIGIEQGTSPRFHGGRHAEIADAAVRRFSSGAKRMMVLSWNIKSFVSAMQIAGNGRTVLGRMMNQCDLISIYELPNSTNGDTELANLVVYLNGLAGTWAGGVPGRNYAAFSEPTGGLGKENDQVGVIYDQNTVIVANTTANRRATTYGGRAPVYFDVTDQTTGNTSEFCAWHAPEPNNAAQLIAQGWATILSDAVDTQDHPRTQIVMGDFNNGDLRIGRHSSANYLRAQIVAGATTLTAGVTTRFANTADYRTGNRYDQFYVDMRPNPVPRAVGNLVPPAVGNLVPPAVGNNVAVAGSGIRDVLNRLVNNAAPLTGLFGNSYNTPYKAYAFYFPNISDHLPVVLDVTL